MIAVFDNFVTDEKLLKDLATNHDAIFADPGKYKYWSGWWNTKANNTIKNLIEWAWGDNCPISRVLSIDGFEYWTGIQTSKEVKDQWNDELGLHFDKDEAWFKETGELKTPVIGSVYYPAGQDFDGGELHIYTDGKDSPPEIVKAKPNRFIIFQAGQHVHTVKTVTRGTRKAIAINLWTKEPYSKTKGILTIE